MMDEHLDNQGFVHFLFSDKKPKNGRKLTDSEQLIIEGY